MRATHATHATCRRRLQVYPDRLEWVHPGTGRDVEWEGGSQQSEQALSPGLFDVVRDSMCRGRYWPVRLERERSRAGGKGKGKGKSKSKRRRSHEIESALEMEERERERRMRSGTAEEQRQAREEQARVDARIKEMIPPDLSPILSSRRFRRRVAAAARVGFRPRR